MLMNTRLPERLKVETRYKKQKILKQIYKTYDQNNIKFRPIGVIKNMDQSKIDRINELARKQKAEGLTDEEKAEQASLRREYIDGFKKSLMSQLDNMYIVEPDGTKKKVTPKQ